MLLHKVLQPIEVTTGAGHRCWLPMSNLRKTQEQLVTTSVW
jgi:hypothetical protein